MKKPVSIKLVANFCVTYGKEDKIMSRLGKTPIPIPKGVQITLEGKLIKVKGPKGQLEKKLAEEISVKVETEEILVIIKEKLPPEKRPLHGLYRSLIENMIFGVTEGFEKRLSLIGVGFRASMKGKDLDLKIGYSHPTLVKIPDGITIKVEKSTQIIVSGCDKQLVGQIASNIRACRRPEPYKGKGIRYVDEYVRKKAGKTAAKGAP